MNVTISMDGLWAIVDSLSQKNKKWLADKILLSLSESKTKKEDEVLSAIARSVKEAKMGNTRPIDTLWDQL